MQEISISYKVKDFQQLKIKQEKVNTMLFPNSPIWASIKNIKLIYKHRLSRIKHYHNININLPKVAG